MVQFLMKPSGFKLLSVGGLLSHLAVFVFGVVEPFVLARVSGYTVVP